MVSPTRRRDAAKYLQRRHEVSERRACRVVGQHRSTQRYERVPAEYELRLVARMNDLAAVHPRWGYRRVWSLLRVEGWLVNRKRIERLWRLEGHRVPPRRSQNSGKRAQGTAEQSVWNLPATGPNHVWSYDFMSGRTRDGSPLRILNVVDEYTRVALGCRVARSIGARDVMAELERLFDQHGKPKVLRSDNGREFIAETLGEWLAKQGVKTAFIEKGSPAAKRVRRALQRHDARRGPQRRRVRQPARGPCRDRRLAGRVQHRPPAPWARDVDTSRVCGKLQRGT
jgi:putative transposase